MQRNMIWIVFLKPARAFTQLGTDYKDYHQQEESLLSIPQCTCLVLKMGCLVLQQNLRLLDAGRFSQS